MLRPCGMRSPRLSPTAWPDFLRVLPSKCVRWLGMQSCFCVLSTQSNSQLHAVLRDSLGKLSSFCLWLTQDITRQTLSIMGKMCS